MDPHSLQIRPDVPAYSFTNVAPWLLQWTGFCFFIILPGIHYGGRAMSRRLAAYRAFQTEHQVEWDQSLTMTLVVPTLLFSGYATAFCRVWSGNLNSRFEDFVPWTREAFLFHAASYVYDFVVWLLPKLRSGVPGQVANAKLFTVHHLVGLVVLLLVLPATRFTFFVCALGLMEGTGLFLGIYRCHQRLRVAKSNPCYAVNGTCLWLSYTVFRVLVPVYYFVRIYLDVTLAPDFCWHSRTLYQKVICATGLVGYTMFVVMSFIWYIKITKKVFSVCARSSHVKEK